MAMNDPEKILSMQEVLEELKKFKQETLGELTKLEDRIIQSFGPDYCKYSKGSASLEPWLSTRTGRHEFPGRRG